jgi:uncharacterized protein (TIGR03083 family)
MAGSESSRWTVDLEAFDLGEHYGLARERVCTLVGDLDDPPGIQAPACPGWTVHDVVAHLVAVVEDAVAGRLTGPPPDEVTREQVERRRGMPTNDMLDEWGEICPPFQEGIQALRIWPGYLDVLAHEFDIRGAVHNRDRRESSEVVASSEFLLSNWKPAVALVVQTEQNSYPIGEGEATLSLRTSPYEVFRFRLGRRSPAQLRAMSWTGDPAPVLDHMAIFGPEPYDLIE